MSNDKQQSQGESGNAAELAQLRAQHAELMRTVAEQSKQLSHQSEQMALQNKQIQTLLSQHQFTGDQQVVNVNLPNPLEKTREMTDRLTDRHDSMVAGLESRLSSGRRQFRICIIDQQNKDRLDQQRGEGPEIMPWNWRINPFNPWRTVGGENEYEAKEKYQKFFGVRSMSDGAEIVCYELDEAGKPFEPAAV